MLDLHTYIALQVLVYASSIDQDNENKNMPKKSSYANAVSVFIRNTAVQTSE